MWVACGRRSPGALRACAVGDEGRLSPPPAHLPSLLEKQAAPRFRCVTLLLAFIYSFESVSPSLRVTLAASVLRTGLAQ